jgi:hypothetical protein
MRMVASKDIIYQTKHFLNICCNAGVQAWREAGGAGRRLGGRTGTRTPPSRPPTLGPAGEPGQHSQARSMPRSCIYESRHLVFIFIFFTSKRFSCDAVVYLLTDYVFIKAAILLFLDFSKSDRFSCSCLLTLFYTPRG